MGNFLLSGLRWFSSYSRHVIDSTGMGRKVVVCYDGGTANGERNPQMIRVRMLQKKKELEIPGPKRVMDILAAAGVRPTTVIVTQGKRLLTKDQRVEDGETVDIISVVSGG
jgi:sulfur carrier protein ThiS